jgi:hypothetical protein
MKIRIALLCALLFYAVTAFSQLGVNCGEHPKLFRNQSGIVWFTPDEMEKMATRRIEPVMPRSASVTHYDGFVTFKVLVATNGDIGCIWDSAGKADFIRAVNEALQYWRYKPMRMDGKPIEFVGVVKFRVHAD